MPLFSTLELSAFILPGEDVIEELEEENERLRDLAVTLKEKVDALSATATSSAGNCARPRPSSTVRSGLAGGLIRDRLKSRLCLRGITRPDGWLERTRCVLVDFSEVDVAAFWPRVTCPKNEP